MTKWLNWDRYLIIRITYSTLQQVEAAEKGLQKDIGRRKKIINSVAAFKDWLKETEGTIRGLEVCLA